MSADPPPSLARPPRPLRVVRIISFMTVGGVQSMLLATLPHFDRKRFDVRVVCTTRSGEVGDALKKQGVPVDVVHVRSRLHPFDLRRLAGWLREARADIVHTHMYASNISGVLAARLAGVPVVISHLHSDHEWRTWGRRRMDRFCDRYRSGYLAVAGSVRDAFFAQTGLASPERVRVLHNAPKPVRGAGDPAALKAELGIPAGAPVVGTVTRLVPVKNLDLLVRAARRVMERVPEVRLVIVGRGREREALARLATELGLGERFILAGERMDVETFYRLFDCFVLCSRSEGCPNALLEAMREGRPIVATRVGGVPELVGHEASALLVESGDEAALASGIARLLSDGALARKLGEAAREASAPFTIPNYVATMEAYYEELYVKAMGEKKTGSNVK